VDCRPKGLAVKILFHHRIRSKDGQAVHMEEMIAAFRALGHEVLLVGPAEFANAEFGHDPAGLARLKALIPRAVYELLELGYNIPAYFRLKRAYQSFQPDFIYERHNLYFLAGTWLRKANRMPLLLEVNAPLARERSEHGGLGLPSLAARLERKVWKSADAVLPVTHVLAQELQSNGVDLRKTEVICNAVDPAKFFRDDAQTESAKAALNLTGKTVLGFTGFVREWHGLDAIVDALVRPQLANAHLVVVGDGPAIPDLKAQSERLGGADKVTFAGLVGRNDISRYVAAFDIALQPKCVEYASPLKLFEYMALGKAIAAPDQPNIREVLENGETALLFATDSRDDMLANVIRLIEDAPLRARLGAAAANAIVTRAYTWRENAARVAALGAEVRAGL
jgi:glycosyltransferase involved in cell wall biosynthesis